MEALNGVEVIGFDDIAQWESWLADHHDLQAGVWMKNAKLRSGKASIPHSDALDVCLCYGWIDSQRKAYDETYYLQKFTPRRPKSQWSKINVGRVEALIAAGRMRAPGLAEVSAAKADGRWDAARASQKSAAP